MIDPKLPVWPLSNERPRFVLGALAGSLSVCVWANFPLNRGSLLLAALTAAKSVGIQWVLQCPTSEMCDDGAPVRSLAPTIVSGAGVAAASHVREVDRKDATAALSSGCRLRVALLATREAQFV